MMWNLNANEATVLMLSGLGLLLVPVAYWQRMLLKTTSWLARVVGLTLAVLAAVLQFRPTLLDSMNMGWLAESATRSERVYSLIGVAILSAMLAWLCDAAAMAFRNGGVMASFQSVLRQLERALKQLDRETRSLGARVSAARQAQLRQALKRVDQPSAAQPTRARVRDLVGKPK